MQLLKFNYSKIKTMRSKNKSKTTSRQNSLLRKGFTLFTCFLLASFSIIYAQEQTITGTVTDATENPLIGVTVSIVGTNTGTITDIDGKYSIKANAGQTLDFSYVGMKAQQIKVGSSKNVNVMMVEDATMLEEAVVIGYGQAKKRDLTGSIVSISADQIANRPVTNPLSSLQGKVAGVQVINTGIAGQDPEIRIRGTNSINGYKPLYVVDGLLNDNINFLNPADIESMEILKDPSSLAIFGVRGANGVVIVTTKKAKQGQAFVNINTSFGFKSVVDKIKLTNAAQFKELYNEQLANQGQEPYDFSNLTADTNWQDEVLQTGFVTNNNISISSSSDKSRFYMGVGYTSEEGSMKHEEFSKITVNLSSDYNITKAIKVGFQFNGSRSTPLNTKTQLYSNGLPKALYAAPVTYPYNKEHHMYNTLPSFQRNEIANPMLYVELMKNTSKILDYRGAGNIFAEVNFLKGFNFKVMYSIDYQSYDQRKYTPITELWDTEADVATTLGSGKTSVSQNKFDETKVQADYLLNYNGKFGDHGLAATAGFTTYYDKKSSLTAERNQGSGLPIPNNPDKWFVSIGDKNSSINDSEQWERTTVSFLLRALYNYQNKYLLNASYRRDGSSAFYYTGNEWQDFYSFGGGWVLTEENFFKNNGIVDYLKLKGSWGTLGNQNLETQYPADPILEASTSAVFGDNIVPGLLPKYIPNKGLKWEKIQAWEAGFESYYLNNRLNLEGIFYNKTTKGLLATIPGVSGTTPGLGNVGSLNNKGVEVTLTWNDKIGKDWRYSVSGNITTIRNRVLSLVSNGYTIIDGTSGVSQRNSYTTAGRPIGYFFGYKVEGIYQSQADIDNSPKNTQYTVKPGDFKFKDIDGNNIIDQRDRTMIGNPTPDFTYGLTLNVGYKNFDLSIDMMGVSGNEIYRTWNTFTWSQFNYQKERMNRWHGEGTSNKEPILSRDRPINNEISDYFIEDGSFFRIRNLQLGYTFDQNFLKNLRMKSLKMYVNIQNLKTWKNNTGYTPELGGSATAFGIDGRPYPIPAIYSFGINLTF